MRIVRYSYPTYRSPVTTPGSFFRSPWLGLETELGRRFASATAFPVDLYEDQANAYVRAELPGVNRDDLSVEMTDGTLTIAAARKTPATEGQPESSTSFRRSLTIPTEVSADQVSAAYENGILTVTLPKREEAKPKKITVAVK